MKRTILLVDDREQDTELAQIALGRAGVVANVVTAASGQQAMAYFDEAASTDRLLPSLVLLDLKMPGMDGHAVLSAIRERPELQSLPVVMFSGSRELRDVERSYALGAWGHVVKPINFDQLVLAMTRICDFWLRLNVPPPGTAGGPSR